MLIDSHCHLDFEPLQKDMQSVIERAYKAGVTKMINVGSSLRGSRSSVEIAERYPNLIKEIHQQGHEIASHGYFHKMIHHQSRDEFREDIRKAKLILEDIIEEEVIGYRAPTYSITPKSRWALEVLIEAR